MVKNTRLLFTSFVPEAFVHIQKGFWQVFWLTLLSDAFPTRKTRQWLEFQKAILRLTAAGTAPDSNRIPYSSRPDNDRWNQIRDKCRNFVSINPIGRTKKKLAGRLFMLKDI